MKGTMEIIAGGVTAPRGYRAAGAHVGIKKEKKDLALIAADVPAVCAGCFTTNAVKAAPVVWDMGHFMNPISGIAVTSGNANACTGAQGLADTRAIAGAFAGALGVGPDAVLVCCTGVIGVPLPMPKILPGIDQVAPTLRAGRGADKDAAHAICTTDTFVKEVAVATQIGGRTVTLGGMAKGSGMIHPNMATLLAFVTTDAAISRELLQAALSDCVADSFNMISIDGDMSTNDTILALANGQAGHAPIVAGSADFDAFKAALLTVCLKLAQDIARDGEGATKYVEVVTTGAAGVADARLISRAVVSSNLVKTALFGADANGGRILAAAGYSGARFDPDGIDVTIASAAGRIDLFRGGTALPFDEAKAKAILLEHDISILIGLHEGDGQATAWGSDLSYDYVKINGDYRS